MRRSVEGQIIYIGQAEHEVSADPNVVLSTILGSCVAVCLYDPVRLVGGMNHFLLPESVGGSSKDLFFGANLMETLINGLMKLGAPKRNLKAKLFGGANVIVEGSTVGERNSVFARSFLRDEGIECVSESLGGDRARRIRFWPTTGRVSQLRLSPTDVRNDLLALPPAPLAGTGSDGLELWDDSPHPSAAGSDRAQSPRKTRRSA